MVVLRLPSAVKSLPGRRKRISQPEQAWQSWEPIHEDSASLSFDGPWVLNYGTRKSTSTKSLALSVVVCVAL